MSTRARATSMPGLDDHLLAVVHEAERTQTITPLQGSLIVDLHKKMLVSASREGFSLVYLFTDRAVSNNCGHTWVANPSCSVTPCTQDEYVAATAAEEEEDSGHELGSSPDLDNIGGE